MIALVLVAITSLAAATCAELWSHARQRERELELLWIGNHVKEAIGLYYQRTPGTIKRYPEKLDDLLEDRRFVTQQRYLRRIYGDPMTGRADWALVLSPQGGIAGIHSSSNGHPIRTIEYPDARSYMDWRFVYEPPMMPGRPR